MNQRILALGRQLERAFKVAESIGADDHELRAHYARYLCVLLSAYLEQSVRGLLVDYAKSGAHDPKVVKYLDGSLNLQNPNPEKLYQALGQFCPAWRAALESAMEGRLRDHVGSVVTLRHQVAHGSSEGGASLALVQTYYDSVRELVKLVDDMVKA